MTMKTTSTRCISEIITPIIESVIPGVVNPLLIGFFLETSPRMSPMIPVGNDIKEHQHIVNVLHKPRINDVKASPFDLIG